VLNSALKRFVHRFSARRQDASSKNVPVAAFGKHPGWDDHIDDIGLDTNVLVTAKRILYVQGIGGNIDSGTWDRLQGAQLREGFKHAFAWCMLDSAVIGRMWSSRDGKGRTSYPMVVSVELHPPRLRWLLEDILRRLERVENACVSTTSAREVRTAVESARADFRKLTQERQSSEDSPLASPTALAEIADNVGTGPGREGLLRVLYHIDREVGRYRSDGAKGKVLRPTLLRVPISPDATYQSVLAWMGFLLAWFGVNTSVLALMPLREPWIDIIVGEPTDAQLYCLRASLDVIPLTSSIPYNMGSEFVRGADQLIEESRSGKMCQRSGSMG
jgi:hypothetical protein